MTSVSHRKISIVLFALLGILPASLADPQPPPKVARVGFISGSSSAAGGHILEALRQGLRDRGYIEGQNLSLEARWAEGRAERFPLLIADLVQLKVNVIVVGSSAGAVAVKNAGVTTPVVFYGVADPVGLGVVASLARPGGNMTGLSLAIGEGFSGKWVELLKDAVPKVSRIAVLLNPASPASGIYLREIQRAARVLSVSLRPFEARDPTELDGALSLMEKDRPEALIVTADPLFFTRRDRVLEFSARRRLPSMFFFREFADAGGLMAYGPSISHSGRRAATFVDKTLKGAKPAELPVEQPTQFELVVNLKTAKALGLTLPQSLLIRADHVIQ
jgi:putative ABC transport system substrate-binding protein